MFSGTAQVSHQVCQFFCQFPLSSCACAYVYVFFTLCRVFSLSVLFRITAYDCIPFILVKQQSETRDGVVTIVTGLQAGGSGEKVSFPPKRPDGVWGPIQPPVQWVKR